MGTPVCLAIGSFPTRAFLERSLILEFFAASDLIVDVILLFDVVKNALTSGTRLNGRRKSGGVAESPDSPDAICTLPTSTYVVEYPSPI